MSENDTDETTDELTEAIDEMSDDPDPVATDDGADCEGIDPAWSVKSERVYTSAFDRHKRPDAADDYPQAWLLQKDINAHGECHAVITDHDREIELRRGNTTFKYGIGIITIDPQSEPRQHVSMDAIVRWYQPDSVFHEGGE